MRTTRTQRRIRARRRTLLMALTRNPRQSVRELVAACGYATTSTCTQDLAALERSGHIARPRDTTGSILSRGTQVLVPMAVMRGGAQ
jgi:DeoR/GlpR family transcriptional regulator of sugar metabolism